MKWDGKDLAHVLHQGAAIYFVLRPLLQRASFLWALRALESRAERRLTPVAAEDHWQTIEERMTGSSRWDAVVPRYRGPLKTGEDLRKKAATTQDLDNMLRARPFTGYAVQGISYTLDVFNPANELEMPYAHAGESVVVLLMRGMDSLSASGPAIIRDRLVENASFYEILRDLDGILQPEYVCGTHSIMTMMFAYNQDRVDPKRRPWEFLYPLYVLNRPPIPLSAETRISGTLVGMQPGKEVRLAKVEDWGHGRVLIQTRPGLDAHLAWEYFAVAKALGMIAEQQLVEGTAR